MERLYLFMAFLAVLLICLYIFMVPPEFGTGTPFPFKEITCIIIGVLTLISIGLIFEYSSSYGGIIVLTQSVPVIGYYLFHDITQIIGYFIIGLVIGGIIFYYTVPSGRYDKLALVTKYCFSLFSVLYLGILIYTVSSMYGTYFTGGKFSQLFLQWPFLVYLLISVVTVGLFIIFLKNIRGVNASEIFIYGDTRSGKSVFLATLFKYGVRNLFGRVPDEIIIGSPASEKDLRLPQIIDELDKGKPPRGTEIGEIALYVLKGEIQGIIPFRTPLRITMIDYAGGYIDVITAETYQTAIKTLADEIKLGRDVIDARMGTQSFLEELKTQYRETFNQFYNIIVPAYLYKRLRVSGKIIFLINGEYITGKQPDFVQYLMKISDLMNHLGKNKSYAFVVTKADEVEKGIRGLDDKNPVSDIIERDLYERLYSTYVFFSAIIHTHIVEFFIISVDNTIRKTDEITQSVPWRFNQVMKFISRSY